MTLAGECGKGKLAEMARADFVSYLSVARAVQKCSNGGYQNGSLELSRRLFVEVAEREQLLYEHLHGL